MFDAKHKAIGDNTPLVFHQMKLLQADLLKRGPQYMGFHRNTSVVVNQQS